MHARSVAIWRCAFFLLPACAATWAAGCSDDVGSGPIDSGADANADVAADTAVPAVDAGHDAGPPIIDCTNDREADGVWKHLACTGLYSTFADKKLADGVKPYKPGVEFWSDGAEKQRFVWLPPNTKIDIVDFDEWVYPNGTKLWKEFKLGGKRIETRIFVKLDDGSWGHTTYRWSADETDAVRKNSGESVPGIGPDGGAYEIPNNGLCDTCHMGRRDQVLGFDAVSLGLPNATGVTLASLAAEGRLSAAPPKTALAFPGSDPAKAAVGWAHINCGMCHNANSNAAAAFRAHFLVKASQLAPAGGGPGVGLEDLDIWKQGYCKSTFRTNPDGGAPYYYIHGGDPSRSLMAILSGARVQQNETPSPAVQMPPIVTRAVDHQGHKLFTDWISTTPPCP